MTESDTAKGRISPEQIAAIALPYYGPRFWDALRLDMGAASPSAARHWKTNGIAGATATAFLEAIERKARAVKTGQLAADRLRRKLRQERR